MSSYFTKFDYLIEKLLDRLDVYQGMFSGHVCSLALLKRRIFMGASFVGKPGHVENATAISEGLLTAIQPVVAKDLEQVLKGNAEDPSSPLQRHYTQLLLAMKHLCSRAATKEGEQTSEHLYAEVCIKRLNPTATIWEEGYRVAVEAVQSLKKSNPKEKINVQIETIQWALSKIPEREDLTRDETLAIACETLASNGKVAF
jgi:hypothetical protein